MSIEQVYAMTKEELIEHLQNVKRRNLEWYEIYKEKDGPGKSEYYRGYATALGDWIEYLKYDLERTSRSNKEIAEGRTE